MERFGQSSSGGVRRFLCHVMLALPMLTALQGAFAQGNLAENIGDEPFQDSILVGKGTGGKTYARNGRSIFVNGAITPLKEFLVSYRSEKTGEKNVAYAFLLGVADATEGKIWCRQEDEPPTLFFRTLDEGVDKLQLSRHDERAAYVITGILREAYPCKKARSVSKSFAQNESAQDAHKEMLQAGILADESISGERVLRQGEAIFTPNLPLKHFLAFYHSEHPEEKDVAYAFLLGVADATENKVWCGYSRFKTLTLLETVQSALRKLRTSHNDERAAYVIAGIFENDYARFCKKEH